MRITKKLIFMSFVYLLLWRNAYGFDPKTHVWVSQQVINDLADGKVTINGKKYRVQRALAKSILKNQNAYRLGSIGPDAHPDVLVGQVLIHPGHTDGRKADEWFTLQQIAATDPEAKAYAYGAWTHAASDIFAHTYVNEYSGGVFNLTDGEAEVEARHFILEKYIGERTPPLRDYRGKLIGPAYKNIKTPKFIAKHYVFNAKLFEQEYLKSPEFAAPLIAMHSAYGLSKIVSDSLLTIKKNVPNFKILNKGQVDKIRASIEKAKGKLELVGGKVRSAGERVATSESEINKISTKVSQLSKSLSTLAVSSKSTSEKAKKIGGAIKKTKNHIDKSLRPTFQTVKNKKAKVDKELSKAKKKVADLSSQLTKIDRSLREKEKALLRTPKKIEEKYREKVEKKICRGAINIICKTVSKWVNKTRRVANPSYKNISNSVQSLKGDKAKVQARLASATKTAGQLANSSKGLANSLKTQGQKIAKQTKKLGSLASNLKSAQKSLSSIATKMAPIKKELLKTKEIATQKAKEHLNLKKIHKGLQDSRTALLKGIDDFKEQIHKLDEVLEFAENFDFHSLIDKANYWHRDIKLGTHEYMKAGTATISSAMKNEGIEKFLSPYKSWLECWLPVFQAAVPKNIALTSCGVVHEIEDWIVRMEELKSKILRKMAQQIPEAQKIIDAMDRWKELAKKEAFHTVLRMISKEYRQFFATVSSPINRKNLNEVFAKDDSPLGLLTFENMGELVDKDLGSKGEEDFDPHLFKAASNAVLLAKMTLLNAKELNRLAKHNGAHNSLYSKNHFINVLNKVASSIDGHFQWTGLDTQLLRENGAFGFPSAGYDGWNDAKRGFRFYQESDAAMEVFPKLFKVPMTQIKLN